MKAIFLNLLKIIKELNISYKSIVGEDFNVPLEPIN